MVQIEFWYLESFSRGSQGWMDGNNVQPCHNTRSSSMVTLARLQPSPLWKSLIALFSTLHLTSGINSPPNFMSPVRYCLLHVHLLSHMAVHLHCHHFHLLSLQSFILNWRLGSLANPFHHRPFPHLPDWFYGLSAHLTFLFCSTAGFVCTVC